MNLRYLWLIPAFVTMAIALLFLFTSGQTGTGVSRRERVAYLAMGLCLQAAAVATAAQVEGW